MWKWVLIAALAYVGFSMFGDRFSEKANARKLDANMSKLADELNRQLPMTVGAMRMDRVAYADHVMHYEGTTLPGKDLTDDEKKNAKKQLMGMYCGNAFAKAKIGVEYTVKVSPTFNDTRPKPWTVAIGPSDCG
ncbi:hypothetical protein [Ottowia testudinis]|uniref:Uncharacterized protein n=1 Tax=Ottowia testudinis TaxID=2816950 RepID=A0A975CGL2_9BURK|nr:hypothetical protein [Ottowia testudinis]QTD46025.1 hypothetical protein J1M35_03695 [Ottowia testudinis]